MISYKYIKLWMKM